MIEAREIFDEEGYKEEQHMKNEIKRKRKRDYYHRHVNELCPEKRKIFFGNANPQKFITHRLKMRAMPKEEKKGVPQKGLNEQGKYEKNDTRKRNRTCQKNKRRYNGKNRLSINEEER